MLQLFATLIGFSVAWYRAAYEESFLAGRNRHMKRATIVSALLIAVAAVFTPSIAEASCHNICVRAYRGCLAIGNPPEGCLDELAACTHACGGGTTLTAELVLKDEARAQSCVIEQEAAATSEVLEWHAVE